MRAEYRRNAEHRVALPPPPSALAATNAAAPHQQQQRHHRLHASRVAVRVATIVAPPRDSFPGRGDRVRHPALARCATVVRFHSGFYALRTFPVDSRDGRASAAAARVHRTTR